MHALAPAAPVRSTASSWRGVALALAVVGAFVAVHLLAVFGWDWDAPWAVAAPLVMALQCWLCVGLFIAAHDAMHGSLAPGRPRLNTAIGSACLLLYAGFDYAALRRAHHVHHDAPGTADDPDFHPGGPAKLWAWYAGFIRRYLSWRQVGFMGAVFSIERFLLGAPVASQVAFWAAPALLSSFQLFYFGTWLPHRHEKAQESFADRHRARSLGYPWLGSLLACYHFSYHHEHHLQPHVPWWGLPAARRRLMAATDGASARPSR